MIDRETSLASPEVLFLERGEGGGGAERKIYERPIRTNVRPCTQWVLGVERSVAETMKRMFGWWIVGPKLQFPLAVLVCEHYDSQNRR